MSEPLDTMLSRLGYVRRDQAVVPAVDVRADDVSGEAEAPSVVYPQVVVVQGGRAAGEPWVRDHAGQLLLAAGVGVFALAALAVVALVAILVMVAMVTCTTALVIARAAAGGSGGGRRGR